MATAKTRRSAGGVRGEGAAVADVVEGEGGAQGFELGAKEKRFLARVSRFLVGVQSPLRAKVARREGYTAKEHKLGWSLYSKAAGQDRSLDHYFDEVGAKGETPASAEQMQRLREIDEFENVWFPRTRALIRRVVPRDERDRFAEAFFQNLEQQPLGPGVVNSVSTFLTRVEGLRTSKLKGAAELRAVLAERGLGEGKLAQVRQLLERVRAAEAPSAPAADWRERVAAQHAQGEAYEALRDWFNDWSVTLRSALPARDQIALGLVIVSRGRAAAGGNDGDHGDEGEGDGGEGEGDEGEGDEGDEGEGAELGSSPPALGYARGEVTRPSVQAVRRSAPGRLGALGWAAKARRPRTSLSSIRFGGQMRLVWGSRAMVLGEKAGRDPRTLTSRPLTPTSRPPNAPLETP